MTIDWKKIAALDFVFDGGLMDIHILNADIDDWNKVIDAIRKFEPPPVYTEDSIVTVLPDQVEKIFERRAVAATALAFTVGKFHTACYFFGAWEGKYQSEFFSLSPGDMTCPDDLEAIAGFMRFLADLTQKTVILCLEGAPDLSILECQPNSDEVLWVSYNNGFFVSIPAFSLPANSTSEKSGPMKVSLRVQLETEDDQMRFQTLVPQILEVFRDSTRQIPREGNSGSSRIGLLKMELLSRARAAAPDIGVKDLLFDKIEFERLTDQSSSSSE